ncbi:MAG TPA: hypothetical protein PKK26_18485 [Candidatus Wallbacteria bacterium]|nr:hypothetical protein [Candidatus Wallbacteria bacterium]
MNYKKIIRCFYALCLMTMANFFFAGCGHDILNYDAITPESTQAQIDRNFYRYLGIKTAATDYYEYKFGKPQKIRPDNLKEYSRRGELINETLYDAQGLVQSKKAYSYDADGNVIEKTVYTSAGVIDTQTSYKYAGGKLKNELNYDSTGKLVYKSVVEYNAAGNATEEVIYDATGNVAASVVYEYSGNNRKYLKKYTSGSSEPSEIIEYFYDASGSKTKETTTKGTTVEERTYNSGKLLTGQKQLDSGVLSNKWSFAYDSHGLLLEKTGYNTNSVIDEPICSYISAYTNH